MRNGTGYQVKLNLEEADESTKRWWAFIMKRDDDKLARMYAKIKIFELTFNPVELILNFVSQYSCENSRSIKLRLDSIVGQGSLYIQNPELLDQ